jgi:hypothetical protein
VERKRTDWRVNRRGCLIGVTRGLPGEAQLVDRCDAGSTPGSAQVFDRCDAGLRLGRRKCLIGVTRGPPLPRILRDLPFARGGRVE